jgi:serine/threonine protein kinase
VKARGPIPWQEASRWILDVLGALEHAHRLKIIHRDLKPSNIILHQHTSGVRAKLLDLGLAKCLDPTSMTQTATKDAVTVGDALLGTFEYMAPEQWRGAEEIVPASDIYSLGCTLFYMLTGGRPPFTADSLVAYCHAHTHTPPPRLTPSQPAIPEALDALVQQMLSKEPAKRGTPSRLIKQFRKLLRPVDPSLPPAGPKSSLPRPSRRNPLPTHTPAPRRDMSLPRLESQFADDPFLPFAPASEVNVAGARTFLRAFFVSRGLFKRVLFVILLVLVIVGVLWMFFRA